MRLLGPRPYAEVPAYLQHADVGLLLLSPDPANAGRSPMKLYEYAAAGLPVLARATPELQRRAEPFVALYDDAGSAVRHLARLLGGGAVLPDPAALAPHDWAVLAQRLLAVAQDAGLRT